MAKKKKKKTSSKGKKGSKKKGRKKSKKKPDILIVAKQNKMGLRMAKRLAKLLEGKADIHFDRSTALKMKKRGPSIKKFSGDFIITVGGDGTFLWTAHQAKVPVLPVKIEGYGFLCTCNFKDLISNIGRLLRGKYAIKKRERLQCKKTKKRKLEKYIDKIRHKKFSLTLNEIAFARKRPSKILDIEVRIDGVVFDYIGDGVMFATPSGSTAYSASAGGSVVDPSLEVMLVVPLYPFFSKIKPMVVPLNKKIEVEIRNGDCAVVIDGHGGEYAKEGNVYTIEAAKPARVIHFDEANFYEKIRNHLMT